MTLAPSNFVPALLFSVVAWRVYRRFRRNVGPQLMQPRRIIIRIVIFSVLSFMMGILSLYHPVLLIGLGAGLLFGVPLALVGLRLTRFETTAEGHFYTPNTYIGVGLSLLLAARLIYRFTVFKSDAASMSQHPLDFTHSTVTLAIFGLLASFYIIYYTGVYMHTRDRKRPRKDEGVSSLGS
jgi:hypothetical protein